MSLGSFYKDRFGISFELFPPKTDKGLLNLFDHIRQLSKFNPDYFTCTYGAGGSTRDKTLEIVSKIKQEFNFPVASHLTLVNSTADELREYLKKAREANVDFIVALRGDPPKGETHFEQTEGGFRYANELVELIRDEFDDFGIAVAGYPEKHQEAVSFEVDLDNLKRKVDCGADVIITQLFYDNEDFFRFRDECEKRQINIPIVPGLLPVTNLAQIQRITSMCAAKLPEKLIKSLEVDDSTEGQFQAGVDYAVEQTQGLIDAKAAGVHFYVLNKSQATSQVLQSVSAPA